MSDEAPAQDGDRRAGETGTAVPPEPANAPPADDAAAPRPARETAPEPSLGPPPSVRGAVEAVLFSSSSPLSARRIAEAVGVETAAVRAALAELAREYETRDGGVVLAEVAGGFQLLTRKDLAPWVESFVVSRRDRRLSAAALETLAIVAYRQPVTRAEVEAIRGVNSGALLRLLIEEDLVKVVGKAQALGRPVIYGTSTRFLEHFGLASIADLPKTENV